MTRRIALVTIAHGRHDHLRAQLHHVGRGTCLPDHHVVVSMDDPDIAEIANPYPAQVVSLDADRTALPLAAARNLGARTALDAGADILVFLDVDCLPGPQLIRRYADVAIDSVQAPAIWSGPVHYLPALGPGRSTYTQSDLVRSEPHSARPAPRGDALVRESRLELFWSLSFALTADDWEQLGGFCEEYVGYGAEDTDLARVLAAQHGRLTWVGGATAYHQHHPTSSPPLQHVAAIVRNANIFQDRWGDFPMLGWLREFEARGLTALAGDRWVQC